MGEDKIVVVLTNASGGQDAVIDVNGTEYTVSPDARQEVRLDGPAEDETVTVTVTVDGKDLIDPVTYDGDCQNPAASVAWKCGSAVEATLTNTGALGSVAFMVGNSHDVGPNGSVVVPLGIPAEGASIDVTVTAPGMTDVRFTEDEVDCQNPAASVAWECGSSVEVTLTNAGAETSVSFDVNGTGHTLAPGETKVVDLGAPSEGDAIDVTIKAPTMDDVTFTRGAVNCESVLCDGTETGVDGDGDQDADSCLPVECDEGETPVAGTDDTNGIADTCDIPDAPPSEPEEPEDPEVLDNTTTVTPDATPVVLDNTTVTPAAQPTATGGLALTGASSQSLAIGALMVLLLGISLTLASKEFGEA